MLFNYVWSCSTYIVHGVSLQLENGHATTVPLFTSAVDYSNNIPTFNQLNYKSDMVIVKARSSEKGRLVVNAP